MCHDCFLWFFLRPTMSDKREKRYRKCAEERNLSEFLVGEEEGEDTACVMPIELSAIEEKTHALYSDNSETSLRAQSHSLKAIKCGNETSLGKRETEHRERYSSESLGNKMVYRVFSWLHRTQSTQKLLQPWQKQS